MKTTSLERGVSASTICFHELLVRHGPAYLERFGPSMPARQREVLCGQTEADDWRARQESRLLLPRAAAPMDALASQGRV